MINLSHTLFLMFFFLLICWDFCLFGKVKLVFVVQFPIKKKQKEEEEEVFPLNRIKSLIKER